MKRNDRKGNLKILIIFLFGILISMCSFPAKRTNAAEAYTSIDYSSRASANRVNMKGIPKYGDCAIASIASIEAYWANTTSGKYDETYSLFNDVYVSSWAKAGYTSQTYSLQNLYNALKNGPVIVHRNDSSSGHYSVVVAYEGSNTALETSGFKVMEVQRYNRTDGSLGYPAIWNTDYNNATKVPLEVWGKRSSGSLNQICVRNTGATGGGSSSESIQLWAIKAGEIIRGDKKIWAKRYGSDSNHYAIFYMDGEAVTGHLAADSDGFFSFMLDTSKYDEGAHTLSIYYAHTNGSSRDSVSINIEKKIKLWGIEEGKIVDCQQYLWAKRFDDDSNHYAEFYMDGNLITEHLYADKDDFFAVWINPNEYTVRDHVIEVKYCNTNASWSDSQTIRINSDTTPPEISNVKVTDITETGYTVTCTVTDNVGINRVQFPSWTVANGQDDLLIDWWSNPVFSGTINGNQASFRVNISEHNYEQGEYLTYIYAIDDAHNSTSYILQRVNVTNGKVVRVFGENRYQTSYKTADALKEELGIEKFDTVIVASGKNFPDALAGSYLASVKKAPILMVNERNVDNLTQYLKKNLKKGGRIYVLGGGAAVPSEWWKDWGDFAICRLEGENRYDTNLMILDEAEVSTQPILICTGKDFPDSLSASATGMPILLVNNKELSVSQKMFLSAHKGNKFYIIGGEGAISKNMEAQIQKYGNTERIAGGNRYETSVRIAEKFFPNAKDSVIAYAKNYPDGLCGGPLAMSKNAPVILTAPGKEAMAKSYMNARNIKKGVVLGGDTLITDSAVKEIYGVSSITVW